MKSTLARLCCIARGLRCYGNFHSSAHASLCTMAERKKTNVKKLTCSRGFLSSDRPCLELPTTVRSMDEHKDGYRPVTLCRTAQRWCAVLVACLMLHTADADADPATPLRHYELPAGDASVMLNEFSRQSDLQVLFDFNILRGMRTHAVDGELDASAALQTMLKGTTLTFDFVNDRTLAVTPRSTVASARKQKALP